MKDVVYFDSETRSELCALHRLMLLTEPLISDFAKDDIDTANLVKVFNSYLELLEGIIAEYTKEPPEDHGRRIPYKEPRMRKSDAEFEFFLPIEGEAEVKKREVFPWIIAAAYDLMSSEINVPDFIRRLAHYGADGVHVLLVYAWEENVSSPWKRVAVWRTEYEDAPLLPFYDLREYDEAWWDRFRELVRCVSENRMKLFISLDDFCSLKQGGWEKYRHPVLSSAPDRDPDWPEVNRLPGGYWAIGEETIEPYLHAYIKRVVDVLKSENSDFYIERMNEYDALDYDDEYYLRWHAHEVDFLISCGVERERIFSTPSRLPEKILEQVGFIIGHGVVRPEKVATYGIEPQRLMLSGDGGWDGSGRADSKGRRGASYDEVQAILAKVKELGLRGYEIFDQGIYAERDTVARFDLYDFLLIERAREGAGRAKREVRIV